MFQGEWNKGRGFSHKFRAFYKHQLASFEKDADDVNLQITLIKSNADKFQKGSVASQNDQ